MGRSKLDGEKTKEKVYAMCEQLLEEKGSEPTVAAVSAECSMSNRETGPIVKAWKAERAAAAQVIRHSKDTLDGLDEVRGLAEKIVKSAMSAMYREHEAAMNAAQTEFDTCLSRETSESHDRIDSLNSLLQYKENTIQELKDDIRKLNETLVDAKAEIKSLIRLQSDNPKTSAVTSSAP